jgi:hypothetical protein
MVPDSHALHLFADSLGHSGAFMAQHHRTGTARVAEINVGMANAAGHQAHQDFFLAGAFKLEAFDPQRTSRLAQHGGTDSEGRGRFGLHLFRKVAGCSCSAESFISPVLPQFIALAPALLLRSAIGLASGIIACFW